MKSLFSRLRANTRDKENVLGQPTTTGGVSKDDQHLPSFKPPAADPSSSSPHPPRTRHSMGVLPSQTAAGRKEEGGKRNGMVINRETLNRRLGGGKEVVVSEASWGNAEPGSPGVERVLAGVGEGEEWLEAERGLRALEEETGLGGGGGGGAAAGAGKKVAFVSLTPTPTTSVVLNNVPPPPTEKNGRELPPPPAQGGRNPNHTRAQSEKDRRHSAGPAQSISRGTASRAGPSPVPSTVTNRKTSSSTTGERNRARSPTFSQQPPTAFHKPSNTHSRATSSSTTKPSNLPAIQPPAQQSSRKGKHSAPASMPSQTNLRSAFAQGKPVRADSERSKDSPVSSVASLQSTGGQRQGGYCVGQTSWSEMAESDLIRNLGPRERTRQEVLWEIVSSEERYVVELLKMKETFLEALSPSRPSSTTPTISNLGSPLSTAPDRYYTKSPSAGSVSASEDQDYLPIASKFSSPVPQSPPSEPAYLPSLLPDRRGSADTHEDISVRQTVNSDASRPTAVGKARTAYEYLTFGRPSNQDMRDRFGRGHHSLPPPPKPLVTPSGQQTVSLSQARMSLRPTGLNPATHSPYPSTVPSPVSTNGYTRMSPFLGGKESHKLRKRLPSLPAEGAAPDLPEDLKAVVDVLADGIIRGHLALSAALRKRYDGEYPLCRSLADVFIAHSEILRGYATYVLHLEKALQQIEDALAASASLKKNPSEKKVAAVEGARLGRLLESLEELAADKGETGLVISLSKPFQRLLKYPLLFQNLLFNTDPSTKEYEATIEMVAEVETIVRSIEDEKTTKEDGEKTRDVFARIVGLEQEKGLVAPKASRVYLEEHRLDVSNDSKLSVAARQQQEQATIKGKKSFKRLSDILKGSGSSEPEELWVVSFTDVSLLCAKTGSTVMPIGSRRTRAESMNELGGKGRGTVRRSHPMQPRNLYRFIKVEEWQVAEVAAFRHGLLSMSEISRIRSPSGNGISVPGSPTDDSDESDDSDTYSRMSFAFGAMDQLQPIPNLRKQALGRTSRSSNASRATGPTLASMHRQQQTALAIHNAKFANRLRAADPMIAAERERMAPRKVASSMTMGNNEGRKAWAAAGGKAPGDRF